MGLPAKAKIVMTPEFSSICSKCFIGSGFASCMWTWIGENADQISVIFSFVFVILAVMTYIRGRNKDD
jgi:hypothetical protein